MLTTRQKVALARAAFKVVAFGRRLTGRGCQTVAVRGGLRWCLDLDEGIDLSIYLLGSFEPRIVSAYRRLVRPGMIVLDIGANIGAHTLPLGQLVGPEGHVYAFEPTNYAVAKLHKNLELNPGLLTRVTVTQALLTADPGSPIPDIPASWPLCDTVGIDPILCSRDMQASGASAIRLDDFGERLSRVDFIKLDVDGNEVSVLRSGLKMLRRNRPIMVLELAPYALTAARASLEELMQIIAELDMTLHSLSDGRRLTEIRVPHGCALNVVAHPAKLPREGFE